MDTPRAWCWGGGRNSTAGIIKDVNEGKRIDLITIAMHGGEKRRPDPQAGDEIGFYDFVPVFGDWLEARGYPRPVECVYRPLPKTHERYAEAAREVCERLKLKTITEVDIERLAGIYGNMVANVTMPGIAFGMKTCSVKWKIEAQEPT